MADQGWKIAIVGGGIGGLTLGLALREQGIEADIYEQADELREVGAAVALSANATRFYEHIGLRDKFAGLAFEINTLIYRDGRSGKVIGKHSGKPSYREQFGAPYWGVHRADLQKILSSAQRMPPITPSEDFSEYAKAGVPSMFFLVGVHDPKDVEASRQRAASRYRSTIRRFSPRSSNPR